MDDQDDSEEWTLEEVESSILSVRVELSAARRRDTIRKWVQPFYALATLVLVYRSSDSSRVSLWVVPILVLSYLVERFTRPTVEEVSSEYSRLRALKRLKLLRKEFDEQSLAPFSGEVMPIWRLSPEGRHQLVAAALGDGSRTVEVVSWEVEPGEVVVEKQPIAHVMYDGATLEFPAERGGRIRDLLVPVGKELPIDTLLCELEPERLTS